MARREAPCGDAAMDRTVIPMFPSPGTGVTAGYRCSDGVAAPLRRQDGSVGVSPARRWSGSVERVERIVDSHPGPRERLARTRRPRTKGGSGGGT